MKNAQESLTAKLCSFARAHHSNFIKQKIFDDYLAFDIMGKEEYDEVKMLVKSVFSNNEKCFDTGMLLNQYISPILLPRIAYAENALCSFSIEHKNIQYVIMGAGMDTFAFRNTNENIKVFELDHPSTQRYKLKRIKHLMWNVPQNLTFVPIDFEVEDLKDALFNSGFNPDIPSFFTILGVSYYLDFGAFSKTIEDISQIMNSVIKIVFDYPDETTFEVQRSKFLADITASLGEPMKQGFLYSDFESLFFDLGLDIESHLSPQDIQNIYFRERNDGQKAYKNIHFMTVRKG
ncbi:class I SAM-dependent methyltransferase [bacterium]|nr:class I SAM-dependent methyltransferase [bacterium]